MAIIKEQAKSPEMNEHAAQNNLYHNLHRLSHCPIVPNIFAYSWESDVLSITKAGFVHEYEIKVSLSDFRADFKKSAKHETLKTGLRSLTDYEKMQIEYWTKVGKGCPYGNYDKLFDKMKESRPNYFWYVCPLGLIPVEEVPEYAGLIYLDKSRRSEYIKVAPRIHVEKASDKIRLAISVSYMWKYWNLRLKT